MPFIFQEHLSANGACGKMWSNKEMPFPFLAEFSAKPVYRASSCDAPSFHKQLNITSLHPQMEERTGVGGNYTYKIKEDSSPADPPPAPPSED